MRVLVAAEATGDVKLSKYNGYYKLTTLGSSSVAWVLTRDVNFDASADMVPGTAFGVKSGTVWKGKVWEFLGPALPTVGTTALVFAGNGRFTTSGAITEYSSTCSVPIQHKAGDISREADGLSHYWINHGKVPAVLLSSDVFHAN